MKKIEQSFEWNRQFFHLVLGVAIVALLMYGFLDWIVMLTIIIAGFILSYLSTRTRLPIIGYLLEKFERKEDMKKFPGKGMIFYFIGSFISLTLFPKEVAMASIMVLAFGDSISHIYGINYGKIRHSFSRTKSLEGTIAGIIAAFFGALVFLPWHEALIASSVGMLVEAIEIKIKSRQFDDNLLIPLASGAVVMGLRLIK